jgi:hypothetical protein
MRKFILFITTPILIFLSACGTSSAASTSTRLPTLTSSPAPTFEALCQKISLEPTPDAKDSSLFPAVNGDDFVVGRKDAAMTIIEYGDFQ